MFFAPQIIETFSDKLESIDQIKTYSKKINDNTFLDIYKHSDLIIITLNDKKTTTHLLKINDCEFENQFNIDFNTLQVFFINKNEMINKLNEHVVKTYNKISGENKKKYVVEIHKLNLNNNNFPNDLSKNLNNKDKSDDKDINKDDDKDDSYDMSNYLDNNSAYILKFITKCKGNPTIIRNLYLHPTTSENNEFPPIINY